MHNAVSMSREKSFYRIVTSLFLVLGLWACGAAPPADPMTAAACIPGQTEVCACIDGSKGAQECKADKTFAGCSCGELPPHDGGVTIVPPSDAGTSTVPSNLCVPGRSIECACTDGRSGAQVCDTDGTYGACTCTGMTGGPADTGTTVPPIDSGATEP